MPRAAFLLCFVLLAADTKVPLEEQLWRHRNLGKAFYENPTTQAEAVTEFRKALQLQPESARERLNYALALLRAGKTQDGVAELLKVQNQDPSLPHTWFNLGIVYRKNGDFDKAMPEFERMVQLVPDEPVSHYNLGVLYKQAGKLDPAREQFETAARLNSNLAAPHFQLYNLSRQQRRTEESARELATFQRLKKAQEGAAIPEDMEWSDYAEIYDPIDSRDKTPPPPLPVRPLKPGEQGQLRMDADGDGTAEILVWGNGGLKLYRTDGTEMAGAGLDAIHDVISAAAGDYDNDGLADLCVLTVQAPVLLHNGKGRFTPAARQLPSGRFDTVVWLDYDHDYDLDLLLLGEHSVLLRNQGEAGFADHTADFPFVSAHAIDAVPFRLMADSKAFDLAVAYADRGGVIYRDLLNGKYQAVPADAIAQGARYLRAEDVNHDSWLDLVSDKGTALNRRGSFSAQPEPRSAGEVSLDKAPAGSKWIRVGLTGVKNLKLAYGAEVELKAGALYRKQIYEGVPLTFPLGARTEADTVRITWANGLIQNETRQAAGKTYTYKEAQRLSGSCPMIWTWDGTGFRFITDVLGVAPLGASSGDGRYFPVDHDEYVQIPGDALVARNGSYEIRITEELSEVAFIDQLQLLAVDHPEGVGIYTNEKFKAPPFPEFRLYGVSRKIRPVAARDDRGHDVLPKLLERDQTYPDTFRHDNSGVAELHSLELDFGKSAARSNQAILVLNGWVDWADGSTFLAVSQESKEGLITPYLQVRNQRGEWQTVIEDMGMPAGKPKTIAVDLSGKFLSSSREVRIVTNLCLYWDEIFLSEETAPPAVRLTPLKPGSAELHFRGFSDSRIDPERRQPEQFFYAVSNPTSYWNPTSGLYTRYGDVDELIQAADDKYIIMGSGDEIRLRFPAAQLAPPRPGFRRDYLLKVDGWAKDRDANTAHSQTVEPLPFHAMSQYPYGAGEHYPEDASHNAYRGKYNTRPALRLLRPLVSSR